MEILYTIYNQIGSLFCHQLISRSIYIDGVKLPLCARDTGVYLGVFTAIIYIFLRGRMDSDRTPGIKNSVLLGILTLPLMIDGVSSLVGLRESNNTLRILTGALFGMAIPFFLIPIANFKVKERNTKCILNKGTEIILLIGICFVVCCLVLYTALLPWVFIASSTIFSLLFIIVRMIYSVISRTRLGKSKGWPFYVFGIMVAFLGFMYLLTRLKYIYY